ncbi:MAG: DUF4102 domain-containing protein, partial [Boseongicola sp. SB0670_bin_30]|nr:DUF4102 domain-containing protein [Boseongicola sp. SB0670_bin_30]
MSSLATAVPSTGRPVAPSCLCCHDRRCPARVQRIAKLSAFTFADTGLITQFDGPVQKFSLSRTLARACQIANLLITQTHDRVTREERDGKIRLAPASRGRNRERTVRLRPVRQRNRIGRKTMPKRRLTQDLVDALEPDGSVREFRDTQLRGFGVRIMPSGRKSWFLHAQHDMRRKWTKLGEAATMSLAKARTLARARLATLRNRNPSRPPDASSEIPFKDVAEAAFRRHARLWKPGTMEVNRHYLKNQLLPHFAGR